LQPQHLLYDLLGLPAAALGLALGVCVYERLDQRIFTLVVVIAMLITGTTYICTSILDLQSTPYVAPARD